MNCVVRRNPGRREELRRISFVHRRPDARELGVRVAEHAP